MEDIRKQLQKGWDGTWGKRYPRLKSTVLVPAVSCREDKGGRGKATIGSRKSRAGLYPDRVHSATLSVVHSLFQFLQRVLVKRWVSQALSVTEWDAVKSNLTHPQRDGTRQAGWGCQSQQCVTELLEGRLECLGWGPLTQPEAISQGPFSRDSSAAAGKRTVFIQSSLSNHSRQRAALVTVWNPRRMWSVPPSRLPAPLMAHSLGMPAAGRDVMGSHHISAFKLLVLLSCL